MPWGTLAAAPLPADGGTNGFGNVILAKVVIRSIVLGVLATWNAVFLWGTRLMLALGRESMIPKVFARTGRFQSPGASVLFVGALGLVGLCLGRGAIVPMINMAAISLAFSYVACCWAVLRLRRLRPHIAASFPRTRDAYHSLRNRSGGGDGCNHTVGTRDAQSWHPSGVDTHACVVGTGLRFRTFVLQTSVATVIKSLPSERAVLPGSESCMKIWTAHVVALNLIGRWRR